MFNMTDSLSTRVARALCAEDPRLALDAVLRVLSEAGVERMNDPVGSPGDSAARVVHELSHLGRQMFLISPSSEASPSLAWGEVEPLIRAAFMRAVEYEDSQRIRERMEMLAQASFEGLMIHDNGLIVDANERLSEITGYPLSEVLGTNTLLSLCVAPDDLPGVRKRIAERYEGAYVISAVRKDGTPFRAEFQSKQGRLGDRPVRVAAVRDVTEREATLTLLREGEMRLRDLAEQAFDFTIISRDGVIVEAAGGVHAVFGVGVEELRGKTVVDLVAPDSRALTDQVISEQRPGRYESAIVSASGEVVPVEIVGVASTLDGVPVRVAGGRDLRESRRKEAEQRRNQLRTERGQRLESLGVLAGGIAHDFNNLLVGVLGNAELLLRRLQDSDSRQLAVAIRTAGERAAALTKQMLAYAGQRDLMPREPVDLGELWRELTTLLDASLSKKAHLDIETEAKCIALGDRANLMQVFMNLLTNASDALEGRPGRIAVRTRHVAHPGKDWEHALGTSVRPGEWIQIEVSDDGVGMDEATAARVFEPFFSTKVTGHGLGLAACLGIVASHGGAIRVESQVGRGSCFSVLLPATSQPVAAVSPSPATTGPASGRILVVDDEPLVRNLARRALERRGYLVEEAADGASALERLHRPGVDLMLVDMTMPDMDGAEVVRRVRRAGYPVAIVLSSGYVDVATERGLDLSQFQGFLTKPYKLEALIESVRSALQRGS